MGRLNTGVSATSSTTTAAPRYSANQLIGAPSIGPTISATRPRSAIANSAARIAAPRPSIIRAATSPNAPAAAINIGSNTWRNWGTPKSNSIWNTDRPMMMPPKPRYLTT